MYSLSLCQQLIFRNFCLYCVWSSFSLCSLLVNNRPPYMCIYALTLQCQIFKCSIFHISWNIQMLEIWYLMFKIFHKFNFKLKLKTFHRIFKYLIFDVQIFAASLQAPTNGADTAVPNMWSSRTRPSPLWGWELFCSFCLFTLFSTVLFGGHALLLCFFPGHCCYSCRAFFRRSTKRKTVKGSLRFTTMKANVVTMITMLLLLLLKITLVRCRSGTNNCLVTEETRNCISCRYDKCIKAGMKVLLLILFLMLMLIL